MSEIEERVYLLGLFNNNELKCKKNGDNELILYSRNNDKRGLLLNKNEKSMKIVLTKENGNELYVVDENDIEKGVVKQINENGSRWEGDWYNEKPFGFGSIYDGEGNRIYSGFMFEGKKIGFGTEFFADNHKVDYCGNFMNDMRHGRGTTYDRNGNKLFEGDWRCGKNDFEDKIVIEFNCEEDDVRIHDLIKELEIGENCYNEWKGDLVIENYPNLQSIVVKRNSLRNLNLLKICNCEKLKTIEIEGGKWEENGAFNNVKNVIIESN